MSFLALESRNDGVLWGCNPSCVITHDLDLAFVRQLEVRCPLRCQQEGACNPACISVHDLTLPLCASLRWKYYLSCLPESLICDHTGGAQRTSCASLREPLRRLDRGPFPGDIECCDLWYKGISQAFSHATGAAVCSKQGLGATEAVQGALQGQIRAGQIRGQLEV